MGTKTDEIRQHIFNMLQNAKADGFDTKDVRAGDIKKELQLGNVPQLVCNAMRSVPCFSKYEVLFAPPSGNSTTLLLRYYLTDSQLSAKCIDDLTMGASEKTSYRNTLAVSADINIDSLLNNALTFYNRLSTIENHRFRSWEHCYSFFAEHQHIDNENIIDLMCLHLSNYLASWGMFRGAAFLLQKDYKVHYDVVKIMLNGQYEILRTAPVQTTEYSEYINKMLELSQRIAEVYRKKTTDFENEHGRESSDTLITKILLGVFGCIPAYDRYFKSGLRSTRVASGQYTARSISQLLHFYKQNNDAFENVRLEISRHGVEYPPMKIVDMCFWQIGYDQDMQVQSHQKNDMEG